VVTVTGDTQAGSQVSDLYPSLAAAYGGLEYEPYEPAAMEGLDLVFLGLPHGASQAIVPGLLDSVAHVVDLAADFRLQDPSLYDTWYGEPHARPDLLSRFAYGLPELFRKDITGASAVAVPGCYPTAASLALVPLLRAGLIEDSGVIVDAASGVSGAGRPPKANTTFCAVDEDYSAYSLLNHRHTPEIEQVTGASVLFTPHLAPMNRGILATCYARPAGATSTQQLLGTLEESYADEPFIVVSERSPSTKATAGSNSAHLTARFDERTGHVLALCAIDNLVKGASGQAVQCANLACGLPEATGLTSAGLYP
jgi:N-acetyl-gamma-glutamyl-phosphate reductase